MSSVSIHFGLSKVHVFVHFTYLDLAWTETFCTVSSCQNPKIRDQCTTTPIFESQWIAFSIRTIQFHLIISFAVRARIWAIGWLSVTFFHRSYHNKPWIFLDISIFSSNNSCAVGLIILSVLSLEKYHNLQIF